MKDHRPNCEIRVILGSRNCTCDAPEENADGTLVEQPKPPVAEPPPAKAAPKSGEPQFTLRDGVLQVTMSEKPNIVIVNGTVYTPLEMFRQ